MDYQTTTRAASSLAADCLVVGVYDGGKLGPAAQDVDDASGGWLAMQIRSGDIPTQEGKTSLLPAPEGVKAKRILAVGLGGHGDLSAARFRKAIGKALDTLRDRNIKSLAVGLTLENVDDASPYYLARHTSELVSAALYVFDEMKSKRDPKPAPIGKLVLVTATRKDAKLAELGAAHGDAIGQGVSLAKTLGNLPPNVCTPGHLAKVAREQAKKIAYFETKVLDEAEIRKLGMGSFLSVAGGSAEPARLIVMQYKGAARQNPVVLVGKGITFDAGGISLKPPPAMDEMKYDMCGAAAVFGAITVAALLKLPINVTAIVPTC